MLTAVAKAFGALEPTHIRLEEGDDVLQIEEVPREAKLRKAALKMRKKDEESGEEYDEDNTSPHGGR